MPETTHVKVRLIHGGLQPGPEVAEPVDFGMQGKKSEVHPGNRAKGGLLHFEFDIAVKAASAAPVFSGPFVHGPPGGRFLYLSWKKHGQHEHPWAWRIKIPLGDISWALIRQAGERRPLSRSQSGGPEATLRGRCCLAGGAIMTRPLPIGHK
jgi:hypothetical protein